MPPFRVATWDPSLEIIDYINVAERKAAATMSLASSGSLIFIQKAVRIDITAAVEARIDNPPRERFSAAEKNDVH